jgi:tripartite-type tricarboxylate transporter receptor subunit TctC
MDRRTFVQVTAFLSLGPAAGPFSALAQAAWPQHSVTIIVPFAPGGQADLAARPLALGLSKSWGSRSSSTIAPVLAARLGRRPRSRLTPMATPY